MNRLIMCFFVLSGFLAHARQEAVPPFLELIQQGLEEVPEIKAASAQLSWFRKNRYGAAFVDEMDVRVGGITTEDTDYAVRIRPTNPFFYAAGRAYGATLEEEAHLAYRQAMEEVLFSRYTSWIEIWRRSLTLEQISKARKWRDSWAAQIQSLAGTRDFDPEDLLNTEIERIELAVDEIDQRDKLANELHLFWKGIAIDSPMTVEDAELLLQRNLPQADPVKILSLADSLQALDNVRATKLEELRLEIEQTRLKIALEKSDWDIGFVQPEWETDRREQFSMRVGIGIPLFRTNRMQIQDRKLDMISENWELVKAESEWRRETVSQYSVLTGLVRKASLLDSLSAKLVAIQQGANLAGNPDARDLLLKWMKAQEKLDEKRLEVQFLLLNEYLEFLKIRGLLAQPLAGRYFKNIWKTQADESN